jgi:hypothetical protein
MIRLSSIVFFATVLLVMACGPREASVSSGELLVGAASAPVNPPLGAFIAGDKQNRKFTSVHDSLYAKAVVVKKDSAVVALVTIDCIGLLFPDVERIRKLASNQTGIPAQHMVVSSTHTHAGPDVVGLWGTDYQHTGVDSVYQKFLIETAAAQVVLAFQRLQPVRMRTAETQFGEPWVQNICDEEIDRSVTTLQFISTQGNSVATLTNFACHPTFLDARYSEVSADYVQGFYKAMDRAVGGENLFLQGAIGGWIQPVDEGTFERAFQRGRELAAATLASYQTSDTLSVDAIRLRSKRVRFPVENEAWKQLAAIGTIQRAISDSVETEITWFAIGPAQFATHPGETAPYYGLETKRLMGGGPRFVLGLANDALGYILKPVYFDDKTKPHAEYLTSMSVGKPTGPLILETLSKLIPPAPQP